MTRALANSSPLIYLAKARALHLLTSLYSEVLIPLAVYTEVVVKGLNKGFEDAARVEDAMRKGLIRVCEVSSGETGRVLRVFPELDPGEAEVLALALASKPCHVIVDDRPARIAARLLGLEPHGTLYVVLASVRMGLLTPREGLKVLDDLVLAGFRLAPELYARARTELERLIRPQGKR